MKKKHGKILSALLSAITVSTVCSVLPIFAEELPDKLMNGSFEIPSISYEKLQEYDKNEAFHDGLWYVQPISTLNSMSGNQFYWKTTAKEDKMELVLSNEPYTENTVLHAGPFWGTDYLGQNGKNYSYHPYLSGGSGKDNSVNLEMKDGKQSAELVANEQASLYQSIKTTPGTMLSWGLSHHARVNGIKDSMALFIGPVQAESTMKKASNAIGSKDIFMWMAELLKANKLVPDFTNWNEAAKAEVGMNGMSMHTVYSKKDIDLSKVTSDNYTEYFSLEPTTEIDQKWTCWIMTSDISHWFDYSGKYDVPDNQTETTFAFTALNGRSTGQYQNKAYNEGNILDDIRFSFAYPLRVKTTDGGSGTVNIQGLDAVGNEVINQPVINTQDHLNNYIDGTKATITATPSDNDHIFVGAVVDGKLIEINENNYSITYNDGIPTYSLDVIIDKAKYVQLFFIRKGVVTYDPAEGSYNSGENGKSSYISMTASSTNESEPSISSGTAVADIQENYKIWHNPVGDAVPSNTDKMKFIGWSFARGKQNSQIEELGAVINSAHTIVYDPKDTSTNEDDEFIVTYTTTDSKSETITTPVKDGITFIAQYAYLQQNIPETYNKDTQTFSASDEGGSVDLYIAENENSGTAKLSAIEGIEKENYGKIRDTVTMTATVNAGYTFIGWYEIDSNGNYILKQRGKDLVYSIDSARTYYARFQKSEAASYVSFISENKIDGSESSLKDTPFNIGSHVKKYELTVEEQGNADYKPKAINRLDATGGDNVFGNTISTGFTANLVTDEDSAYNTIQWTITIPTDSVSDSSLNTYVKVKNDDDTGNYTFFTYEQNPVLSDSVTANYFNKGSIHKVSGINLDTVGSISDANSALVYYGLDNFVTEDSSSSDKSDSFIDENDFGSNGESSSFDAENDIITDFGSDENEIFDFFDEIQHENANTAETDKSGGVVIKLQKKLDTSISGGINVSFGLIIDNIYAPRATAEIIVAESNDNFNDVTDVGLNNENGEIYRENENNPYYQYELDTAKEKKQN